MNPKFLINCFVAGVALVFSGAVFAQSNMGYSDQTGNAQKSAVDNGTQAGDATGNMDQVQRAPSAQDDSVQSQNKDSTTTTTTTNTNTEKKIKNKRQPSSNSGTYVAPENSDISNTHQ